MAQSFTGVATDPATQSGEEKARSLYRSAFIVRACGIGALVILGGLALFLQATGLPRAGSDFNIVTMVFAAVSVAQFLCAFFLTPLITPLAVRPTSSAPVARTNGVPNNVAGRLFTRAVLNMAFTTAPGLLGFVLAVSGVPTIQWATLMGAGVVAGLITFPLWSQWETAIAENGSPGAVMPS